MTDGGVSLDRLATDIIERSAYRFTLATDEDARLVSYRLRWQAVVERGWRAEADSPDGLEYDGFDARAVHVVGWDGAEPISTGRLVLPPGPLPTDEACGISVEPRGKVVDVGRMTVARSHQGPGHSGFIALLARLYLEVRARDYSFACGMMSVRARSVLRLLGLPVEMLGEDRQHWGEPRAPVRFAVTIDPASLGGRWR